MKTKIKQELIQKKQSKVTETGIDSFVFSREFDHLLNMVMYVAYNECQEGEVVTSYLDKAQAILMRDAKKLDRSMPGHAPITELAVVHLFGFLRNPEVTYRNPQWVCDAYLALGFINAKLMRSNDLSKLGKYGAQTRHASMRALKEWALSQYQMGHWKSANQAAHALKEPVITHGRSIGAILSTENAQRTIARWISQSKKSA